MNRIYINARFMSQPITGVQRYARELVRALDGLLERGEIDRATYSFEMLAPGNAANDLELTYIPMRKVGFLSGHAWEQLELPLYTKGGVLFNPGNTAPLISLTLGQKTVTTVHSLAYLYFPQAYSTAFKRCYNVIIPQILRRGTAIITVSHSERDLIVKRYSFADDRLHVIHNGGGSAGFTSEISLAARENIDLSKSYILFVGSLSKGKNLQGVIDALSLLQTGCETYLRVVGAEGKSFRAAELNIPDGIKTQVEFLGQIDHPRKLVYLYQSALCLVFASFYESSGLPPIEAMSCGCPVIASDIPALRERCGDAALYCNPNDPADIAAKVQLIISDASLRESLRQKGLVQAREFTWEKCARETFQLIKQVLEGK